jgi:lipopolysaccharide biosynthesis glycosyltransferase
MKLEINLEHNILENSILEKELTIKLSLNSLNTNTIISIKTNKNIKLLLNDNIYNLTPKIQTNIIKNSNNEIIFKIKRLYEETISYDDIEFIYVYEYGNPVVIDKLHCQVVYSFDKNYFVGGFSSIYSLLYNIEQDNIEDLNINVIIPEADFDCFIIYYNKLVKYLEKNINFSIYLINKFVIDSNVLETTCFKGGNHLLKLSNYSRLLIGHLINVPNVLYIDADTIVQKDITNIFNKLDTEFIIMGKRSNLNYNNLFNCNNKNIFSDYIGNKSEEIFLKNVIYTGTLIINPQNLKKNFENMMNIVKLHNSVSNKGGLYKLFTMSIINIGLFNKINYFDSFLKNVVDLGHNTKISTEDLENADILDWSGIYKPWFTNGLYHDLWKKYNLFFDVTENVTTSKNTTEKFE